VNAGMLALGASGFGAADLGLAIYVAGVVWALPRPRISAAEERHIEALRSELWRKSV
jgi:hypothetical protein